MYLFRPHVSSVSGTQTPKTYPSSPSLLDPDSEGPSPERSFSLPTGSGLSRPLPRVPGLRGPSVGGGSVVVGPWLFGQSRRTLVVPGVETKLVGPGVSRAGHFWFPESVETDTCGSRGRRAESYLHFLRAGSVQRESLSPLSRGSRSGRTPE